MIPRYTPQEMGRIWNEQRRYETWLEVESVAAEVMAKHGLIPVEAARDIREKGAVDAARVEEIEQTTQHDIIAFTTAVAEQVGPSSRWMHFGLTSSDVVDTALALQLRAACDTLLLDLEMLMNAVRDRAQEHSHTPMIGRTHGVHAEPITFGLKLALWYAELQRDQDRVRRAREIISVGKISGAVGTYAHLDPVIEQDVCESLGLKPSRVTSQVIQRDRHAEFLTTVAIIGGSLEKFATEIRGLQKTEVREVEEPFAEGQTGSSSMPHKRNPEKCERITGIARILRGYASTGLENIALWHERDISHSSTERVILPDACLLLDYALDMFTDIVSRLQVYPERMLQNMEATHGLVFSQRVLLELIEKGLSRDDAYGIVQRNAMECWGTSQSFLKLLSEDKDVTAHLNEDQLRSLFDYNYFLSNFSVTFERLNL